MHSSHANRRSESVYLAWRALAGLLASAAIVAPTLVRAQEAPAEPPRSAEEIIVTGSRVANGNSSPVPVTVVQADELLKAQPTTLFDGLAALPVFAGSRGQLSQTTGGPSAGGNGAVSALNLRNLSPLRNLVLVNGQRVPPATYNGLVDVDIIPEAFIQRVDTVTGGVSAVYGSDAVSGVINFITDNRFVGIKAEAQAGISNYGDGAQRKANIAAGTNLFGGRGHIEASYNHLEDDGIASKTARPWNLNAYGGANTAASPYVLYSNVRQSNFTFGGLITNGPLARQTFNSDGALTRFVEGTSTGSSNAQVGGDGAYNDSQLKAPLNMDQFFVRFDYDLSDDTHFHVQAMGADKRTTQYISWNTLSNVTIDSANAFLPPSVRTALGSTKTFTLSKIMNQAPRYDIESNVRQYFINTGLNGKLGASTDWGIDFNYGDTRLKNVYHNNINNQKLSAALDAVVNPVNSQIVCNASLTMTAYANCVPLNPFGPTAASTEAIAYITDTTHLDASTRTYDVLAHVSSDLFDTWAGPVRTALSAEWRRNSLEFVSDSLPTTLATCTGLRYNCSTTQAVNAATNANMPRRSQTVKEAALEVLVPLLKDSALAENLDFTGAARYTSYSTTGNYWTWKLGFDWKVNGDLSFRGTLSRDIRAPTLYDLYQPVSTTVGNFSDYLLNGAPYNTAVTYANIPLNNYGNPALKAETGLTRTLGGVYQPHFLPGFSLSVDYYRIKVKDAIQQINFTNVAYQQACYQSGGTSIYCTLQNRTLGNLTVSPANVVTSIAAKQFNIASITTQGVDAELNYRTRLGGHALALRGFVTYQPHIYLEIPGAATLDYGSSAGGQAPFFASARWRLNGSIRYDVTDNFTFDLRERWRSSLRYSANPNEIFAQRLQPVAYTDLNLSFRIDDTRTHPEFYVNIQNLFNKAPPAFAVGTTAGQSYALSDDPVGRYFTVGVRARF
jgi:iron complex outermembrane receptor protein